MTIYQKQNLISDIESTSKEQLSSIEQINASVIILEHQTQKMLLFLIKPMNNFKQK